MRTEAERYYTHKHQQEALRAFQETLQLIALFETVYPVLHLNHLKSLLLYYCSDICYYNNYFRKTLSPSLLTASRLGFCDAGLNGSSTSVAIYIRRARCHLRMNEFVLVTASWSAHS